MSDPRVETIREAVACVGDALDQLVAERDRLRARVLELEAKLAHRCWACGRLANDPHEDGCEEGPTDTDVMMRDRAWREERELLTPEEEEDDRIEAEALERVERGDMDGALGHLLGEEDSEPELPASYGDMDGTSSFGSDP